MSRVLFLVATKLDKSLDPLLRKLVPTTVSTAPPIAWDATSHNVLPLPEIASHICFARHYAVGAMDRRDWEDAGLSHFERFRRSRFWEHLGSIASSSRNGRTGIGEAWDDESGDDIRSIEAVQFLGWTDRSDQTISNEFYVPLFDGWTYRSVWWNCQSFATRLAFLLVEYDTFSERVQNLAASVFIQLLEQIAHLRNEKLNQVFSYTMKSMYGSGAAVGVASVVFPPSIPFLAGCVSGSLAAFAVGFVEALLSQGHDHFRLREFRANMKKLEETFPTLVQFHQSIAQAHARSPRLSTRNPESVGW